jgi:hypothetical protein
MQSLRGAFIQIDADVKQCALLLPQDLKVAWSGGSLFIAGAPVTSAYSGIGLDGSTAPPYCSVVRSSTSRSVELDSVDIDGNSAPDYWADLGIITDSGPSVISHNYSRENTLVPFPAHKSSSCNPAPRLALGRRSNECPS